ncbi:MAG: proline dehydrogenase, partial [Polyangiaceae bacterium]|nr:proline dehydrogenase [Polyangiaceae bacterium]
MDPRRERVLAVLDVARAVADASTDLGGEARLQLLDTTGLSPAGVDLALRHHLETAATDDELASLLSAVGAAPRCHVVLAANVCTAACRAIALATATSERVVVRPSRRDPGLAPTFVRELARNERFLRAGGAIASASELDAEPGDEVHAYGSDDSIRAIRGALPPGVVYRGHGTGIGLAVVSSASDVDAAAAAVASDIVAFDQKGCLSPRIAIVVGDVARGEAFSIALHQALARAAASVPRGELDARARSEVAAFRSLASSLGSVREEHDHLVAFFPDALPVPPPHRTISVTAVSDAAAGEKLLSPVLRFLTTIGGDLQDDATRFLAALRGVRRSTLGRMQKPAFDGPVDRREGEQQESST